MNRCAVAFVVAVCFSCATSSQRETVQSRLESLMAADNARNVDAAVDSYTEDVVWIPPSGEPVKGRTAIRDRYRTLFAGSQPKLRFIIEEVKSDGRLAYARGETDGTLTSSGGTVAVHDKFLALLRFENGAWRISHLMWGPVVQR